jgi:TonB family protein
MKAASLLFSKNKLAATIILSLFIGLGILLCAPAALGQGGQLSLADILIALRSKKVTLPERNKILTDAVLARGITFSLTPEIEKELESTGADTGLIDSIRKKSTMVKTSAVVTPTENKPISDIKPNANPPANTNAANKPAVTQPVQDFAFFMKQGQAEVDKSDLDAALVDFGKAIEMKPDSADAYLARGLAHMNKKAIELAITDLTKASELNPKSAVAFNDLGDLFEKKGDVAKAKDLYKKALDIDANIEPSKSSLAKITADELKAQKEKEAEEARKAAAAKPVVKEAPAPVAPEFLDRGLLMPSDAVKMVTPVYSQIAIRAGVQGKVRVDITIDADGKVLSAKAVDGPPFLKMDAEDAAKRSTFKPATFNGQPNKSKGYVIYNFTR